MDFIVGVGKFLWVLFQVIVLFNLLIVVHELGHYWAAKWRGLKVEKFQIWFGKPVWKKEINGVQWGLGTIPMGGFVALPQMAPMEMLEGSTEEKHAQLPPISPMDKIIVAFAGPLFSFGLAFAFALLVWGLGKPVRNSHETTVVGYVEPGMKAEAAGVKAGDRINKVNGVEVRGFVGMIDSIMERIIYSKGETIDLEIERPGVAEPLTIVTGYDLEKRPGYKRKDFRKIGVHPKMDATVGAIFENSPAAKAGLKVGDVLEKVDGQDVLHPGQIGELVRENPAREYSVVVRRPKETPEGEEKQYETLTLPVLAEVPTNSKDGKAMLGIRWSHTAEMRIQRPGPNPFQQVWDGGTAIFRTIGALFSSSDDVNVTQMSSAVGIGNYYFQTLSDPVYGWRLAFVLSVLINVNLGLLNLLPFPVLDGGHIMMATYEGIRKRPMNMRAMELFQATCALLLIGFMLFVTWFDVGDIVDRAGQPEVAPQELPKFAPAP